MKQLKNKVENRVQAIPVDGSTQMLLELIISVAQLANIDPADLAKQTMKKERFGWFMNNMTSSQLEETKKMMESIGEHDMVDEVDRIKELIEKENNDYKTKSEDK